jgi:hypothetical protein
MNIKKTGQARCPALAQEKKGVDYSSAIILSVEIYKNISRTYFRPNLQ